MMLLSFLLLLFWQVSFSWSSGPPHIVAGNELVIETQKQSFLTLRCEGSKRLHWMTSTELSEDESEDFEITHENDTEHNYVSILTVKNVYPGDTGYYYCYYSGATDFTHDKENVDSTYVYVNGEQAFVNHGLLLRKQGTLSESLVIDCITTHPEIIVTLKHGDKDITNRTRWDPKVGFVLDKLTIQDSGVYTCESLHPEDSVVMFVQVITNKKLPKPSIYSGENQHFVEGDNFSLDCTLINHDHDNVIFHWAYPNTYTKYIQNFERKNVNNITYLVSTLLVPEASAADTGLYTCTISSPGASPNNVSKYIEIKDNLTSFINITSSGKISTFEEERVSWKAVVQSYPSDHVVVYTDWRGQEVKETDRITIEHRASKAESWLMIKNITRDDFGNYTITATTSDGAATDSVTVMFEIKSAPQMTVKGIPRFMTSEQTLHVTCLAQGFPLANISLQFQDCPSGPASCSSFIDNIQLARTETHVLPPGNRVEVSVRFSPRTPGWLRCTGQNDFGIRNTTAVIRISEIGGIFVLRHFGQDKITEVGDQVRFIHVVENDDFALVCGGSKFDYKSVKLMHKSQLVPQTDASEFSWVTKEETDRATKTLEGNYTCIAESYGSQPPQVKSIIITILDEEQVQFAKGSNMNKSQTVTVKENEPFYLNCTVTGTPSPIIQWLKDNKTLTPKSELFDEKAMSFSGDLKVLTLNFVLKKHAGVYTCIAQNRLNKVTSSLTLQMPGPGMSTAAVVGLAIALVGIAILVIVVVFLISRVKKEKQLRKSLRANEIYLFEKGNIGQLNPDCTADEQAELLPYDKKWEVPRKNITLGKQLGSGAFGRVIKASVTGLEGPAATTVAIKMCKSQADASQVRALMLELKIMIHLGKHLNIVNLMGANTVHISTGELWILAEYCRFGNLLVFMQRHRKKFLNQINPATGKIDHFKFTRDPFSPVSPCPSRGYPSTPAVDQDGYLAPNTPKFVLSDPPPGHSTKPVSSTMLTDSSSVSGGFLPQGPDGQYINNPMYSMGLSTSPRGLKEESEGSDGCRKAQFSDPRDARLLSTGTNAPSDARSASCTLGSVTTGMTTLMHSASVSSPLSPTDSYLGEVGLDSKGNPFVHEVGSVPGVNAPFSTSDLICWGWQVAQGMDYLSRRNVLHGDLAARNLLLSDNNVVKISDFGLSRDMYKKDVYMKKGDDLMPVKWISVEAIRDQIFSVQSDVWAYGITLWEIFSLGSTPYPGIELNSNFLQLLEDGYRMSCPKYANQEIYNILMQCWKVEPMDRPSFSQLVDQLGVMMLPDLKGEYLSMNDNYIRMNEKRFKEETDYLNMLANPNYESMTKAEEVDIPHYVNVSDQTRNFNYVSMQLPDTVGYSQVGSLSSPSSCASSVTGNYLAMDATVGSQNLPSNVFSSQQSTLSRFTFSSNDPENSRLTSFPEEEECVLPDPEEPSENSTLINIKVQSHSEGKLSNGSKNEVSVVEKKCKDDANN